MRSPHRIVVLAVAATAALLALTTSALADQAYHTLHTQLTSPGGQPAGWIADIHANGPIISAHEEYHLVGASPNTTYQVVIHFFPGVTDCSGTVALVPTAQLTTNANGNGNADWVFAPGPPGPVTQNSAVWEIDGPGGPYTTGCEFVLIGA